MTDFPLVLRNFLTESKINSDNSSERLFEITSLLADIHNKKYLTNHPFFSKLMDKNKSINYWHVGKILSPFYFAVWHWTTSLSTFRKMLKNYGDIASAKLVKENIEDELGYSNNIQKLDDVHILTYTNFLHALDFSDKIIYIESIKKFNKFINDSLHNKTLAYHAALLGAIEHFYIEVSSTIKNYCDNYDIEQEHYRVHEIVDQKHAADFFEIAINQDATNEELINGIHDGYLLIWNVYLELYDNYAKETFID